MGVTEAANIYTYVNGNPISLNEKGQVFYYHIGRWQKRALGFAALTANLLNSRGPHVPISESRPRSVLLKAAGTYTEFVIDHSRSEAHAMAH